MERVAELPGANAMPTAEGIATPSLMLQGTLHAKIQDILRGIRKKSKFYKRDVLWKQTTPFPDFQEHPLQHQKLMLFGYMQEGSNWVKNVHSLSTLFNRHSNAMGLQGAVIGFIEESSCHPAYLIKF